MLTYYWEHLSITVGEENLLWEILYCWSILLFAVDLRLPGWALTSWSKISAAAATEITPKQEQHDKCEEYWFKSLETKF